MKAGTKCYACDKDATSWEHVPPKCLFPEEKDTKGVNYRKDLIKVPSCHDHNSKKSKDDEFLMISMAGIVGNNALSYWHNSRKVSRALRRKDDAFLYREVIRNAKELVLKMPDGSEFPILFGSPNFKRLSDCFINVARGLYYQEFGSKFTGKVKVLLGFVQYEDENTNVFVQFLKKRFELEDRQMELMGGNPKVFKYQFCKPDEFGLVGLKMTFYEAAEVFIALQPPKLAIPEGLFSELLKIGVPVTISLGDEEFKLLPKNEREKLGTPKN